MTIGWISNWKHPIAVLIVFSFNDSKSRSVWHGFTFRWYEELFRDKEILNALMITPVSYTHLHEAEGLRLTIQPPSRPCGETAGDETTRGESGQIRWQEKCTWWV